MSDLTNKRIQDSYGQVLTIANTGNDGIDSILRNVEDGAGSGMSPLQLSTSSVNISGLFLVSGINFQDYLTSGSFNQNQLNSYLATGDYTLNLTVRQTGDQNISGVKNFFSRPTVNGTGVLLSGEAINVNTGVLTGVFYPLYANPSQFISTGAADSRYYSVTNPSNYATSGDLISLSGVLSGQIQQTGAYLLNVITSISGSTGSFATTGYVNAASGALYIQLTGYSGFAANTYSTISYINNISGVLSDRLVLTGINLSGAILSLSGDLISSGNYLNTKIDNFSGYSNNTFATILNLAATGQNLQNQINLISSGTGNFATTGYVNSASGFLQNEISQIITWTGNSTGVFVLKSESGQFYPKSNPSGYITGISTGNFVTTNQTGQFYASSNPSGFLTGFNSGEYITTGQSGQFQPSGNYVLTSQTGQFYSSSNPSGYITGLSTGNFITTSQTGQFVSTAATGSFATTGYVLDSGRVYNKQAISFYLQYANITGNNLNEFWLLDNITITGIRWGSLTAASGNLYYTSGTSGSAIVVPYIGSIYQISTGNNQTTAINFNFPTGITYSGSGVNNVLLSGNSRVGISITSGVSGVVGLDLGLFGYYS